MKKNKQVTEIHHIGYLVKDINKSALAFEQLGFERENNSFFDAQRQVTILFMHLKNHKIELVCPSKESEIYPLLNKFSNQPYHICYEVSSLEIAIEVLRKDGYMLFLPPAEAKAISSTAKVAFLINQSVGIVELLEK